MNAPLRLCAATSVTGIRAHVAKTIYTILFVLAASASGAHAQSFSLPIHRNVGFNPNAASVGDFNNDGKLDVAVANTGGGSVTIALGNGDGTIVSSFEYNTDLYPQGVAVGDFNHDGKLDVAVANMSGGALTTGGISVLFGHGDGQADAAVNYNVPGSPNRIVAVDLNSDGNLDLVTACFESGKATVLLGNANGTFNAAVGYTVGTHPLDVAVADFNNDGKLDIATPNSDGANLGILLGNGDGTFPAATTLTLTGSLTRPYSLAAGDLNGDGNPDLVFPSPPSAVGVALGNGDGTFQPAVSYPTTTGEAVMARLGDLNGDGKLDVAVINAQSTGATPSVGVLRGNGDGTLQAIVNWPTQSNPWGLVIADLNNDAKLDVLTTNNGLHRINVLLNSPSARGINFSAGAAQLANGILVASFIDYDTAKTAASFTATIDWGDGTATSAGTVAPNVSGGFNVTGSHTYALPSVYTLSVQIADTAGNFATAAPRATVLIAQTITFGSLSDTTFGSSDFSVSATATSGLVVSFAASGQCTIAGTSVHITGAGSCTITASQAGDTTYGPAPNVARTFQIAKADQTISFAALSDKTFGTGDFDVSATASSGLSVSFAASGNCSISTRTVHLTGAGSCMVTASQAGDSNFNPAANVQRTFQIAKGDQTINFAALSDKTFGAADFDVNATATSGLSVSFGVTGNCSISTRTVHLTGAGSCTVTASQPGDSNFNPASSVQRTFQVAKASTSITVSTSANPSAVGQSVTFTATAASAAGTPTGNIQFKVDDTNAGAPVTLSPSGAATFTISGLSPGAHTITAQYGGDSNFNSSTGMLGSGQTVGSLIEFSQSNYNGTEGGTMMVAVRRTGDTSQAASVDYVTDDGNTPPVAVSCSSTTGLALERCDFTKALGTLRFAAGETEKTFQLLVVDDSYVEGPETLTLRLANPAGSSALGATTTASVTIADDSPESSGNPIDDDAKFVAQHYRDFLNRDADPSGLQFWTNEIASCGADSQCREVKRINVSAAFFLSIEFQETGFLSYLAHKAAYGDATSPGVPGTVPIIRLGEFLSDAHRIGQDVRVGIGNWEQQLEANKNAYALEFVQRPRFTAAFPATMTGADFVAQLNSRAGGVLSATEQTDLINILGATPSDATKRAQVLRAVAEDSNLRTAEFNRAFVLTQYYGYLRRNPDDPQDTNFGGWKFWLDKLDQFNGNFVQAEMVKAFILSTEYRRRFGQH